MTALLVCSLIVMLIGFVLPLLSPDRGGFNPVKLFFFFIGFLGLLIWSIWYGFYAG